MTKTRPLLLSLYVLTFTTFTFLTTLATTANANNNIGGSTTIQPKAQVPKCFNNNKRNYPAVIPSSTNTIIPTTKTNTSNEFLRGGANTKVSDETTQTTSSSSSPTQKKINPHVAILYGMALAFNSGLINGVTLSGLLSSIKQPSSAVTGSWTNSALAIAESTSNMYTNLGLKCIYAYMGGSFVAGVFNPYPINYTMKRNTIRPSFLIASLAMYLSHYFVSKESDGSVVWILLAVFANGIQNSVTSSLTSNLMRTAHFSGITSDMGTFLGQAVRGNKANGLKLKLFYVLGPCFWYGGYFSLGLTKALGSKTLLISSILYLLFGIFSI